MGAGIPCQQLKHRKHRLYSLSSQGVLVAEAGFQLTNEVLLGTASPELCPIG
jgi:hypothetical protein